MRARGFTLVELMATIVVATLIIATGVPGFLSAYRTHKRVQAKQGLIQDLRTARQLAVTRHSSVVVRFGDGTQTTQVGDFTVHIDVNADRVYQSTESQSWHALPRGVALASVQLTPRDSIIFDPSGALWPGTLGGWLILQTPQGDDTLEVSAVGMVYDR